MLHTYEQKSQSRDELVRETHRAIRKLTQEMARSICNHPEVEELMQTLSAQLKTVKGKKSYGYLPKSVKKTVDEVVDKLEELPEVRECYEQWCALQSEVDSYYHDKPREKKTLSQEKEFRQIKNAVIQEAERIRLGEIAFEDANLAGHDEAEWVRGESDACWELRQIIRDEYLSLADRDGAVEELEWLAERGDTHAQYLMGQLYRDGPLLIPDSQKAKDWFTQAAEHGLPEAQYALGKLFLSADMEVRDPDEGIRWLKQAAESGSHFAAYHDEGKHPHVHMMAWSTVPGEAYLTREGIRKIKSNLTNQIFRQEMLHTYEQKSQSRDELVREPSENSHRRWHEVSATTRRWRN